MSEKVTPSKKSPAQLEAEKSDITFKAGKVSYTIAREVVDDVELMESLADLDENPLLLARIVRKVLGDSQWVKFKEANRNAKGRVPSKSLGELFLAINEAMGKSAASSIS